MASDAPANRAGRYVKQPTGYSAYIPAPLPPTPPLKTDQVMTTLLSNADRALGRLDGVASVLPNPDLFVAMYVNHEAVLSSQIEGTQSTLQDLLQFGAGAAADRAPRDIEEVVNYVAAMNHGLNRLRSGFPLSLRLIREIHERLLRNVRGSSRTPGEFRTTQNWIGASDASIANADFVPPPPHEMRQALHDFELFLHNRDLPVLVHCALAHAQFETIHPFLDGNGRVGRLLITFLLCERDVLQKPLLYLSYYLKGHRAQYYDRLTAIRTEGDWEGWLRFFLAGVHEVSNAATQTAREILSLREQHRELVQQQSLSSYVFVLLDKLFEQPLVTVRSVERMLGCTYATANNTIQQLADLEILVETTGQKRNRRFIYSDYITLFDRQSSAAVSASEPIQETFDV